MALTAKVCFCSWKKRPRGKIPIKLRKPTILSVC